MKHQINRRFRSRAALAVLAVVAAVPLAAIVTSTPASAADAEAGDGTTSSTAGASCWGIKQQFPASADGLYWLNTALLERPQQFACDMTTEGGGWVLVGRGRQGWTFNPNGQGSPSTVRNTVDGAGAFAPAALSTDTISALLNGATVSNLADGIRLERATNTSGTSTQDYRLFPTGSRWTWSFDAAQLLEKVVIDGQTYRGSNTYDTSDSVAGQTTNDLSGRQGTRRMFTYAWSQHGNKKGFSFGSGVNGGSSSSSNHLWTNGGEGSPIPFTQVWLRPRIANDAAGFTPIPAEGFAAEAKPTSLKDRSEFANWGVVGLDHTNESRIEPYNTSVLALRVSGDRTFVGGRFTGVQAGPSGAEQAQPYLAAFDLDGNWISSFRPSLDGRVWDMLVTPDGKLIIAGDFTSVNGAPNTSGLAALDPTTGQVITSWKATIANTSGRVLVRALDQHDGTIYAAGSFNRITGGTWNQIRVSGAASVSTADGTPQGWRPRLSGQAVRIRATEDGTRVLLAGYFNRINDDTNHGYFGITDAATGAPVPGIGAWEPSTGSNAKYQQAVADLGDGRYVVGGSEHNIQLWSSNRSQLLDAAITKQGGDTQVIEVFGDTAYIGCHCGNWVYQGTNNWTSPSDFRSVEPINLIGAWNTETWEYDTSWYPSSLKGASGEGTWAADQDSRGCLWVGGDLNRGGWSGNAANDWLGGFARFCPDDATPPTAPTALAASAIDDDVRLTWGASSDDSGTLSYDVYRDDRVIATVWGRSYTDTGITDSHVYTVRASDARGNRSASPAPVAVNGPSPVIAQAIELGSTWRYDDRGTDIGTQWRGSSFDDSTWPTGDGMLGWGRSFVETTIGANKPNTVYFRRTFDIADPAAVKILDVQVKAATGAIVYVNGIEAGRVNMPNGAATFDSPASGYIWGAEDTRLKPVTVPGSLLVAGTNTIAVEVHNMTPNASRLLFDLQATAYSATTDDVAPSAPALTATASSPSSVTLDWTAASDDVTLGGYQITRDGQPLAVTGPASLSFIDAEVDASTPHTYTVVGFDMNGNATPSNTVSLGAVVDPSVMAFGSEWAWSYTPEGQADGWQGDGFDDAAWTRSPAELGYGDRDEATLISDTGAPRPLTAYFRTTVDIADPTAFSSYVADLIRDDGAVVYVNGVEVGRDNMPDGPVAPDTPSATVITDRNAERTPVQITIPSSAFRPGTNTIAVEVHNTNRWSGDLSFDLRITGVA